MKTSIARPGARYGRPIQKYDSAPHDCPRARRGLLAVGVWLTLFGPLAASAQLQIFSEQEPQRVFGGEERKLAVTLYNAGTTAFEADVHTRLYQANAAKAVLLSDTLWKHVQVLPGQTVHDAVSLPFPQVKTETRYLLQWTDGGTRLLSLKNEEVIVHPVDLLKDLKALLGNEPLGLYDPTAQLKPLVKAVGLEVQDLEKGGLEDYHGKLAIIGPFVSKARMRGDMPSKVKALADGGVAVIWILPPPDKRQELQPSFFTVPEAKGAVVVVQAALLANLAENPQTQLHLLKFARLALHPEPPKLPFLGP
jgi:hypothetical protein